MKRFLKGAAITGGIFLMTGLIVMIIGIVCGGMRGMNSNRTKLKEIFERFDGIELLDGININFGGKDNVFVKGQKRYSDGVYTIEDIEAPKLNISVGAGDLKIKYHSEPVVKLEISKNDQMQCYVKDNTLNIRGGVKNAANINSEMIVYLPEGENYKEIFVDIGAGSLVADAMSGGKIEMNVGMGHTDIDNVTVKNIEVSVGMGQVEIEGNVTGDATIDCGMGQVNMELKGNGDDFDYELDCGVGSLTVDGVCNITGVGDRSVDNDSSKEIEISVGMGSVEVKFSE